MCRHIAVLLALLPASLFAQERATLRPERDHAYRVAQNARYSMALTLGQSPQTYLAQKEASLAHARSEFERFLILPRAAKAALEAAADDRAERYALEALQLVRRTAMPDRVGAEGHRWGVRTDAVFYGNLVLGRLAVLHGDVESARRHLLLAGQAWGDATLDNDGPNMSLARELLLASERDTVIQFLEECRRFWRNDEGKIDLWEAQIQRGEMPTFGLNLFF